MESQKVQDYLHCLIRVAGKYGLEPNWGKTLHLRVGHEEHIRTPAGDVITPASQAQYLGSLITVTGKSSTSVNRKIGEASTLFSSLCDIWKNAGMTQKRKIEIYNSCVVTKLLFHWSVSVYG